MLTCSPPIPWNSPFSKYLPPKRLPPMAIASTMKTIFFPYHHVSQSPVSYFACHHDVSSYPICSFSHCDCCPSTFSSSSSYCVFPVYGCRDDNSNSTVLETDYDRIQRSVLLQAYHLESSFSSQFFVHRRSFAAYDPEHLFSREF